MKLESKSLLLSQDVEILGRHMKPCVRTTLEGAMATNEDRLGSYKVVLPHLSSFFFKRFLLQVIKSYTREQNMAGLFDEVSDRLSEIDTGKCPVYMLTGEYDHSCTPQASRDTAALIDGADLTIMEGMGHFPMSEDPEKFRRYLLPVLGKIG